MSAAPPVSVLLPVWNAAPFLEEALESLAAQTFASFEVLLEDDGSTDGSREIAADFARGDARVQVEAREHKGVVSALNQAARRARGSLLVRMDADDVAVPQRLERLVEAAREHPDAHHLSSLVRYVPRAAVGAGMRRYETWINTVRTHEDIVRQRFVECPVPHPTWALRRQLFEAVGGYREGAFPEDYDFFLRAVEWGARFHKVEEVLLDWREGRHRASRTDDRYALDAFFELKVRFLARWFRDVRRPAIVLGTGKAGRRWARRLREEGIEVRDAVTPEDDRLEGGDADAVVLCTVAAQGGRDELRARLTDAGRLEGEDFLCVQ